MLNIVNYQRNVRFIKKMRENKDVETAYTVSWNVQSFLENRMQVHKNRFIM